MASEHRTDISVRYAETDQMGTVHHASYPLYFEQARVEHLIALGLPYDKLEGKGVLLPVVEMTVQYVKPLRFGDRFAVVSRIPPAVGARLFVEYEIVRGGELMATGRTVHAFLSRDRRPLRPPPEFKSALDGIEIA